MKPQGLLLAFALGACGHTGPPGYEDMGGDCRGFNIGTAKVAKTVMECAKFCDTSQEVCEGFSVSTNRSKCILKSTTCAKPIKGTDFEFYRRIPAPTPPAPPPVPVPTPPAPVPPPAAQKHLMTEAAEKNGAVCLDGTPGAYYLQKGTGDGVNKWYIHHKGGGWCESMDDCLARSKTILGSSKAYPKTFDLGVGYFDTSAANNPLMYNWNHVFMMYCDGASFSGNNDTVAEYKRKKLHFRGKRIREAFAEDLMEKQGMNKATDLIVSGCSAGGLATFLHTDQWCDALKAANPSAKCAGLPDSGFFLDYQDPTVTCQPESGGLLRDTINGNYHCGLKWAYAMQNATAGVHQDCVAAHKGEEWMCMFAEHSSEHIHSPIFAMQSQYDSWQAGHVQGSGGNPKTQELGNNITERIQSMLMANNKESGAFLDSCQHHCGKWNRIRIDGDLVSVAIQKWYNGIGNPHNKRLWNQNKAYPCVECCRPVAEDHITV